MTKHNFLHFLVPRILIEGELSELVVMFLKHVLILVSHLQASKKLKKYFNQESGTFGIGENGKQNFYFYEYVGGEKNYE